MKQLMKKFQLLVLAMLSLIMTTGCSDVINTVNDKNFTPSGHYKNKKGKTFVLTPPGSIKFYIEVSGSMNGFFRTNMPTKFKADLWNVLIQCSRTQKVCVLTNDGDQGMELPMEKFKTFMSAGNFISNASTKIPLMLKTVYDNLNVNSGEVAVLVSDMKYDPVGEVASGVLPALYSSTINEIVGVNGKAICLVGAVSDYLDKNGNDLASGRSPYYYLIIGKDEQVAYVRNVISTILDMRGDFIDNIESGFNYGSPSYKFGIPKNCEQLEDEPTFVNCQDEFTLKLKVNLENYRWLVSDTAAFKKAFEIKALYGSKVQVTNVQIQTDNATNHEYKRISVATVNIKVSQMQIDSDVLEWTLNLPDTDRNRFNEFLVNATNPNDPTKSYSLDEFFKGVFVGGITNKDIKSNFIMVSKNN